MATAVDAKLLKQTKFPPEFNKKVDMKKVNIEVMKKWIAEKISIILGNEDDVVIELCFNLLEGSRFPNVKHLQIQLTGFLDKDTAKFCKDLWNLCLSAQENSQGVPKELLEAKKLELMQEKLEAERAVEEAARQREQEQARERDLERIRQRERDTRGWGRRGRDQRLRDRSFSPPRRRRSPDVYRDGPARRKADTYVPSGGRSRRVEGRGRRTSESVSPSPSRSPSRSVTPPRSRRRNGRSSDRRRRDSSDRSRSPYRSPSRSPYRRNSRRQRENSPRAENDRSRRSTSASTSSSRSPSPKRRRRSTS